MKIVIDCIHENGLTPDEQAFIHLLKINRELLKTIVEKDLLKVNKERLISTGYILAWNEEVSEIILSNVKAPKDQDISIWIDRYREVFKNKKAGAMGSKNACIEKMKKFIQEYPEFSDPELIISAASRYVNTQRVNNYMYLQRADYIISKKDSDSVTSRLAAFCEEIIESSNVKEKFNEAGRQTL